MGYIRKQINNEMKGWKRQREREGEREKKANQNKERTK